MVAWISGWEWPRMALIWPEVKSSILLPSPSYSQHPSARTGTKSAKSQP